MNHKTVSRKVNKSHDSGNFTKSSFTHENILSIQHNTNSDWRETDEFVGHDHRGKCALKSLRNMEAEELRLININVD